MVFPLPAVHDAYPDILPDACGLLVTLVDLGRDLCCLISSDQTSVVLADRLVPALDLLCDGRYRFTLPVSLKASLPHGREGLVRKCGNQIDVGVGNYGRLQKRG